MWHVIPDVDVARLIYNDSEFRRMLLILTDDTGTEPWATIIDFIISYESI